MRRVFGIRSRAAVSALILLTATCGIQLLSAPTSSAVTQGGSCNGFTGARALGASYTDSSLSVPACGPQPMLGGAEEKVYPYQGANWVGGYQCMEFSERYLYYRYGVTMPISTNGDQLVDHYVARYPGKFTSFLNGTVGHAPLPGDVLSFANSSAFSGSDGGHTAVVQSSSVDGAGNGSILIIEQNGGPSAADGSQTLAVKSWSVQYPPHKYVKWLHAIPQTLPAQPLNPAVRSTTQNSATIGWTDASNNEDSFVFHYRIGNGAWVNAPTVGANATSTTIGGLQSGTKYTFQVGARNAIGTKWSVYFYGWTVALPAQPTNPQVRSVTWNSAVLTWGDASNNESRFVSQYKSGSGGWVAGPSAGANATSMTIGGLQPGIKYTFQIGAQNLAGTHWSEYAIGATTQILPAQPANPVVTATSAISARLAWTDASSNEASFVSQYRTDGGKWVGGPGVDANVTSLTVAGLKPGTKYTFQVGAKNSVGVHWSAYFYGWTVAFPAEPTNVRVASTSDSTALLTWTDASNNESDFVSQYRVDGGNWVGGPAVGANSTSMTIGGLRANTPYTFQIGSRNSAGTHWSAYASGRTSASSPPPAYHAGRQVSIDSHATGGVSGHKGPANSFATGPTHPVNSALWIVCYVQGQSITGPYNTTTIWDLGDDGYYYTDAWLYTGTNGAAVMPCSARTVKVDSRATGGVSGHRGPGNPYATGPTHAVNSSITIECYVDGEAITGPYNTTTIWDLSDDGYYYTDAWLYTGTNGAAVPHC